MSGEPGSRPGDHAKYRNTTLIFIMMLKTGKLKSVRLLRRTDGRVQPGSDGRVQPGSGEADIVENLPDRLLAHGKRGVRGFETHLGRCETRDCDPTRPISVLLMPQLQVIPK